MEHPFGVSTGRTKHPVIEKNSVTENVPCSGSGIVDTYDTLTVSER